MKLKKMRIAAAIVATSSLLWAQVSAFGAESNSKSAFKLYDPGTKRVVDYAEYGIISNAGSYGYKYTITDENGLAKASGEGIDPNTSVERDPSYRRLKNQGKLNGSHWKYVGTDNPQADFFVWATAAKESPGTRLFFTAKALNNGRLYLHALKAYRAAMIMYPDAFCWNRELTWTWLIAPAAWDEIINLTRMHPELELKLTGAFVKTKSAIGGNPTINRVAITPGRFIKYTAQDRKKAAADLSSLKVVERHGGKKSACVKYSNGQWGLEVDGKPFFVKGLTFGPVKVGHNYDWDWMHADQDGNEKNDIGYDTFIDKNGNGRRDEDEPAIGDFKLMHDMGCNTIRIFNTIPYNKELLRDLYKTYGIRVLICDPFGAYTVHSGARWEIGTDYTDPAQRKSMKSAVAETVKEYGDEEWLLGYILGNENNMPTDYMGVNASRTQAGKQQKVYAEFLNEVAAMIHRMDPDHIVGVGNLGLGLANAYALYAPELDFIGANSYPGSNGFGALWIRAKFLIDRPILITEFGCDAYETAKGPDEKSQEMYLKNAWDDIASNAAGGPGEGNSIGGIIFEWLDEWWKDTRGDPWDRQNKEPTAELAFPDGFSNEEWLGIVGQGDGQSSPFLRAPRKAYYTMKELWSK